MENRLQDRILGLLGAEGSEAPDPRRVATQHALQRFADRFAARMLETIGPLSYSDDRKLRLEALRRGLAYYGASIEIALGPAPELNVVDMVVFVTLARDSFESQWMPEVFGEAGQPILDALEDSEEQIWELASRRVLSVTQTQELRFVIERWRKANPTQAEVATVRLAALSNLAVGSTGQGGGLFSSFDRANRSAEDALFMGERLLLLSTRLPDLIRLHARLGAQQIAIDSTTQLSGVDGVADLPAILSSARALLGEAKRLIPGDDADVRGLDLIREQFSAMARTLLVQGGLLAAGLIVLFWLGYVIAT